jgi:serine/threonine protein kinase
VLEEEITVGPEDFEHIKVVGEGGYGRVVLVKKIDTKKYYAMKILEKSKIKTERSLEHIVTERKVLMNDSPFLLHLHFSFQTDRKLFFVTDFLPGGDLFHHLAKRGGRGFHPQVVHFFIAELALALEHLHQSGFIYRDMKLENVLLDEQGFFQSRYIFLVLRIYVGFFVRTHLFGRFWFVQRTS